MTENQRVYGDILKQPFGADPRIDVGDPNTERQGYEFDRDLKKMGHKPTPFQPSMPYTIPEVNKDLGDHIKDSWKPIPDLAPYEASSLGKIRNTKTENVLKPFLNKWGYQQVDLSINGRRERRSVHRLIMLAFKGESELPVNHKDGVKTNNWFSNLEYVTNSQNEKHAWDTGLKLPENHRHSAKIEEEDAMDIVERVANGERQCDLSLEYGISRQEINDIVKGRTWASATGIVTNSKCDTGIETKKQNFAAFVELVKNQFWHGGEKYKLNGEKEFTDAICECFPGVSGVDWVLGTCMKYLGRYKNFGREKDLLKIATYMYILWLKGGFHTQEKHDEDATRKG